MCIVVDDYELAKSLSIYCEDFDNQLNCRNFKQWRKYSIGYFAEPQWPQTVLMVLSLVRILKKFYFLGSHDVKYLKSNIFEWAAAILQEPVEVKMSIINIFLKKLRAFVLSCSTSKLFKRLQKVIT